MQARTSRLGREEWADVIHGPAAYALFSIGIDEEDYGKVCSRLHLYQSKEPATRSALLRQAPAAVMSITAGPEPKHVLSKKRSLIETLDHARAVCLDEKYATFRKKAQETADALEAFRKNAEKYVDFLRRKAAAGERFLRG